MPVGRRPGRVLTAATLASALLLVACTDEKSRPSQPPANRGSRPSEPPANPNPEVTFYPPSAVRGALLRVTVDGLEEIGAEVDISFSAIGPTGTLAGGGVRGEYHRVGENGQLDTTFSVPNWFEDFALVPGEYWLEFDVKSPKPRSFKFKRPLQVVAAVVGEKYPIASIHECLEYQFFDGRLWRSESAQVTAPVDGSTFELSTSDRAIYETPAGKTVAFRVVDRQDDPFDPYTYSCP